MSEQLQPQTEKTNPPENKRMLSNRVMTIAFVILFAFLALIAWGLRNVSQGPVGIGDKIQTFTIQTFDGQTINTADLRGKVILINFWASWCKPCEQEAAELEQAWKDYQDNEDVVFLGVAYVDTEVESLKYLDKFDVTYPNGPDLRSEISGIFRTRGVPETYIIGKNGRLAYVKVGPFMSLEEIETAIEGVLEQP